jgi:hypothetical protein
MHEQNAALIAEFRRISRLLFIDGRNKCGIAYASIARALTMRVNYPITLANFARMGRPGPHTVRGIGPAACRKMFEYLHLDARVMIVPAPPVAAEWELFVA